MLKINQWCKYCQGSGKVKSLHVETHHDCEMCDGRGYNVVIVANPLVFASLKKHARILAETIKDHLIEEGGDFLLEAADRVLEITK